MNLSKEKKVMLLAAKSADKVITKYFDKKFKLEEKKNKSLVTEADLESNDAIIKIIKQHFQSHNILSEEMPYLNNGSNFTWILDPIDGTHNFVRGIPICGVSIALKYKKDMVLGVMSFPGLKMLVVAEKGKGAFLNGKKMKVSSKRDINHSYVLFEFSSTDRNEKHDFLRKFIGPRLDLRNFGSAIYNLTLVAAGKADAYVIFRTNEWDVAAGFLAVEEAGGKVTDLQGKPAKASEGGFIISNGKIHDKILRL